MQMNPLVVSAAVAAFAAVAVAGEARLNLQEATLDVREASLTFRVQSFAKGWVGALAKGTVRVGQTCDGDVPFVLPVGKGDGAPAFEGRGTFSRQEGGRVAAAWTITAKTALEVEQAYVGAALPMSEYAGGAFVVDGAEEPLPQKGEKYDFGWRDHARRLVLRDRKGVERLCVDFAQPTRLRFQDDSRFGGDTFSLRMLFPGKSFAPGASAKLALTLSASGPLELKRPSPVTLRASDEWLPFTVEPEIVPGSALDFSRFRGTDAPAGNHGRVVARNGHFEFEGQPGRAQRFYGVNLCFSANYVDAETADRLAAHLARVGYNAVRIHHHDGGLAKDGHGTELDPVKAKMLDGLVAACVKHGLYMTTDLFVSRRIPWRDIGVDRPGAAEMGEFKELVQVHEGAYSNYIAFARNFLGHVNCITGRRNADEPALAWLSLVNEGNLGNCDMKYMAKHPEFAAKYAKWLAAKKASAPETWAQATGALPKSLYNHNDPDAAAYEAFLADLEAEFAAKVTKFLRVEMKSRQLVTNVNNWHYPATLQRPRAKCYDYVDDHFYVDHPRFLEQSWRLPSECPNVNPLKNESLGVQGLALRRVFGRPFTITEYNYSGPGRYRGVGGIVCGAMASLQGWDGLWRFAWSHDDQGVMHPERAKLQYFNMTGDPLGLASERASICLFLRRDLPELAASYAAALPERELAVPRPGYPDMRAKWLWAGWYAKLGNVVADRAPAGMKSAGPYPALFSKPSDEVRRDLALGAGGPKMGGGAISVDGETGSFVIDTPRTCGGFTERGAFTAGALRCDVGDVPATVWVSALDGRDIVASRRLLLTHLTDVQNSGIRYAADDLKVLLDWGGLPHLMRNGRATCSIALRAGAKAKVWALRTDGTRRAEVPVKFSGGRLEFVADVGADRTAASYIYEIAAE